MKRFIQEFKSFAFKGNMLDMAVGVMIGGAISKAVSSLVDDIIMPVIGLLTGGFDLSGLFLSLDGNAYANIEQARAAGAATLNYGTFLTCIVDFLIMALCIFIVIKLLTTLRVKRADKPKDARKCPFCMGEIDDKAVRCPHCTSLLEAPIMDEPATTDEFSSTNIQLTGE